MRHKGGLRRLSTAIAAVLLTASSGWFGSGGLAYDPTARVSLAGQVGLGGLQMGDVNHEIRDGNRYLTAQSWTTLKEIHTGFNFAGDLRAQLTPRWSISIGGGRTTGKSKVDFDQVIEVRPYAHFFHARLLYHLPFRPTQNVRLAVGGGPLDYFDARLNVSHEQRQVDGGTLRVEHLDLKGSGWGFQGLVEAEVILSEQITLVGDLGYRQIKVNYDHFDWKIDRLRTDPLFDTDGDGVPDEFDLAEGSFFRHAFADENLDPNGDIRQSRPNEGIQLDYSGVQANIGLRFYLF
jgi:hypothetical protein